MKKKIKKFLQSFVGDCCQDCVNYKFCFGEHIEYNKQNTLEHPSCKNFVRRK